MWGRINANKHCCSQSLGHTVGLDPLSTHQLITLPAQPGSTACFPATASEPDPRLQNQDTSKPAQPNPEPLRSHRGRLPKTDKHQNPEFIRQEENQTHSGFGETSGVQHTLSRRVTRYEAPQSQTIQTPDISSAEVCLPHPTTY